MRHIATSDADEGRAILPFILLLVVLAASLILSFGQARLSPTFVHTLSTFMN